MFELLAHPSELQKVKDELAAAIPDKNRIPSYSRGRESPLFQRLHPRDPPSASRRPVTHASHFPEVELVYHDQHRSRTYTIPPGTTTSMSTFITHTSRDVFQDPYSFRPQRWLDSPKLSQSFITFSRGSRNCVG